MEFRLGGEQRICGQGDVVVIPGGTEHEAWFREDTEVIDFFAPPREDFLLAKACVRSAIGNESGFSSCRPTIISSVLKRQKPNS
jgi:hypothetical protein